MKVNKSYVSGNNTYESNNPQYIVVHNTDNFTAGEMPMPMQGCSITGI